MLATVLYNSFPPSLIVEDKTPWHHLSKTLPNIDLLFRQTIRLPPRRFRSRVKIPEYLLLLRTYFSVILSCLTHTATSVITDQRNSMKQYLFMLLQSTFHISQTLEPNVNHTPLFATAHVHHR